MQRTQPRSERAGLALSTAMLLSGCVSVSVHPRALDVLRFEPRPPPADFVAHPVTPERDWLTKVGRVVGELELAESTWSSHRTPEGELSYVRGLIRTRGVPSFDFSCGRRELSTQRQLTCFIRQLDDGEVWLLSAAGRIPFAHRAGLLLGPRSLRFVTDNPVRYPERAFVYELDRETPVAVGDAVSYSLPREAALSEPGPALVVLLLSAIPFSYDENESFLESQPPVATEDGSLRVFHDFDARFPGVRLGAGDEPIAPERARWRPLLDALEAGGAVGLAHFGRVWSSLESSCRDQYQAMRSRSRALGFSAELAGHLGSNAALGGYAGGGGDGAPVAGGFGISFGPTLFRRLALQVEVGVSGPITSGLSSAFALPAELEGSLAFFLGPRARFVLTEPDADLAVYLGGFHHWYVGSAGSLDEVASVPISGRGLGGFLGAEYCVVGSAFERFCAFSELGAQYRWLEFGTPTGEGARGEAIVERLRDRLQDTGGLVPELRLGVRFGF